VYCTALGERWEAISISTSPDTSVIISFINLKPKTDYEFRVFALNEQGLGPPSPFSEFIQSPGQHSSLNDCRVFYGPDILNDCSVFVGVRY